MGSLTRTTHCLGNHCLPCLPFAKSSSLLMTLSRQLDISSVVLFSVSCLELSLPKCCWKALGWCHVFTLRKKMPQGDAMGGPLDKPIQRPGPATSSIYFVCILLAGKLKVVRTADLLVMRNGHIPKCSIHLTCPAGTSLPLHGSSSCLPSPPPPLPLFGTDLKPPQVTQWATRLRPGFVKIMLF